MSEHMYENHFENNLENVGNLVIEDFKEHVLFKLCDDLLPKITA